MRAGVSRVSLMTAAGGTQTVTEVSAVSVTQQRPGPSDKQREK